MAASATERMLFITNDELLVTCIEVPSRSRKASLLNAPRLDSRNKNERNKSQIIFKSIFINFSIFRGRTKTDFFTHLTGVNSVFIRAKSIELLPFSTQHFSDFIRVCFLLSHSHSYCTFVLTTRVQYVSVAMRPLSGSSKHYAN